MKKLAILYIILPWLCNAQSAKWTIEPMLIFSTHFSKRTPIRNTPIGYVKAPPAVVLRDFGLDIQKQYKPNRICGIRLFNQEYEFGFRPTNNGAGAGLSVATGMTWSRFQRRIMQYNIEFYSGLTRQISAKNSLNASAGIQLCWLPYSYLYEDTNKIWPLYYNDSLIYMGINDTERLGLLSTKYIKHPAIQNNNLRIQIGLGFGWEHQISRRIGYGFSLNYRQGFNPLFIDGTEIFVDYFTNRRSQLFQTKITGTGLQFCNRFVINL
jgi:hypothetical protein